VLDAAAEFGRAFPMMMTAAGTVPPARALIMGVGVAGLQAITTAKRLGAIVSATDVRPAVKEQVQSLGGTFVAVEDEESACCREVLKGREVPYPVATHATRTDSGRPRSSMRLRTSTAIAISVAWAASVWERSASPITCLKRPIWASTRARRLY
jgi:D-arabinose 1-dehydrogenase-like Zn-dependent alcohol dehydrogenase